MPKMTNPNQERPLSVQHDEVATYKAAGWELVGDAPAPKAKAKPDEPTAVTRKSVAKKSAPKK